MTLYYFDTPVVPIQPGMNGSIWCEHPNGKRWKHWADQLKREPVDCSPGQSYTSTTSE